MSENAAVVLMTSEEFFALPDVPDVRQRLFRGELREEPVTKRNPFHSRTTAIISHYLWAWTLTQPHPQGEVYDGEAYFRIRRNPDTNVGIDVAYAAADLSATMTAKTKYLDGPPLLAVEVLSPNDTVEEVTDTVAEYLACGVMLVWIVNPFAKVVAVHRPNVAAEFLDASGTLVGDPEMPGLRVRVRDVFRC